MKIIQTNFEGLFIIEPKVFEDDRGFFFESYKKEFFINANIGVDFVQDNHAKSKDKNIIRGLHFQKPPMDQTKLVRVIAGSVFDVAVDLRKKSKTFGQWYSIELNSRNKKMLYIPKGFAHGYQVLEENTEFLYKVDQVYSPVHDSGIIWNDSRLNILWPLQNPLLSEKDKKLMDWNNLGFYFE